MTPLEVALSIAAVLVPVLGALVKLFILDEIKRLREWRHAHINEYASVQVLEVEMDLHGDRLTKLESKVFNGHPR